MSDLFGRRGRDLLERLRLPPLSQGRLEACLRLIDDDSKGIEVKHLAPADPSCDAFFQT